MGMMHSNNPVELGEPIFKQTLGSGWVVNYPGGNVSKDVENPETKGTWSTDVTLL